MKLSKWLSTSKVTVTEFAGRIGVHRQAVYRWANGERLPRKQHITAITRETEGQVTALDWFDEAEGTRAA